MSIWCNQLWLFYGGWWADMNVKHINGNLILMSGMCVLCNTEKATQFWLDSLSRSEPVNTCATKNTIWASFMCTAGCIVVKSCVHVAWCCVGDKYGSETSCREKISLSWGIRACVSLFVINIVLEPFLLKIIYHHLLHLLCTSEVWANWLLTLEW